MSVRETLEKAFIALTKSYYTLLELSVAALSGFAPPHEYSKEKANIEKFISLLRSYFNKENGDLNDYLIARYYTKYLIRKVENPLSRDIKLPKEYRDFEDFEVGLQVIINSLEDLIDKTQKVRKVAENISPSDEIAKAWMDFMELPGLLTILDLNITELNIAVQDVENLRRNLHMG